MISVNAENMNNTNSVNAENDLVFPTWVLAFGTIFVGIVTSIVLGITYRHQKKQGQMSALMEILQDLREEKNRSDRRLSYQAYNKYEKEKDLSVFSLQEFYGAISATVSHFNQIGILIEKKIIPKEEFFDLYADTVLYCWGSLKEHIENEQQIRKNKFYMNYFKSLGKDAEKYWKKNHPDEEFPKPYFR
jgi:hypothetical protein